VATLTSPTSFSGRLGCHAGSNPACLLLVTGSRTWRYRWGWPTPRLSRFRFYRYTAYLSLLCPQVSSCVANTNNPKLSPRLLYQADPRSLRSPSHGRNILEAQEEPPPNRYPQVNCSCTAEPMSSIAILYTTDATSFQDINWVVPMSQGSSKAAANSKSEQKSAPIPPNRSQRPTGRPRDGKLKRTLIESACTACQKRKSRVSLSPSYCLCLKYLYEHVLIIFLSATGSGR
jgi:hypothetical protein